MEQCVVIGRGYNYATAFELALKLKELTYVGVGRTPRRTSGMDRSRRSSQGCPSCLSCQGDGLSTICSRSRMRWMRSARAARRLRFEGGWFASANEPADRGECAGMVKPHHRDRARSDPRTAPRTRSRLRPRHPTRPQQGYADDVGSSTQPVSESANTAPRTLRARGGIARRRGRAHRKPDCLASQRQRLELGVQSGGKVVDEVAVVIQDHPVWLQVDGFPGQLLQQFPP